MQNVGAARAMTSLSPSPLLVALVQSATSLPVFIVGLPAGTVADIVDRRQLLLVSQTWMLAAAPFWNAPIPGQDARPRRPIGRSA
jgi:MFS family permease